jgi:hypothetical protein
VRHHLVQRIIRAYDEHKTRVAEGQMSLLDSRGPANGNGAPAMEQHSNTPANQDAAE